MTKCGQISQNRKPSVPALGDTDNCLLSGKVQFISWLTQNPNYKKTRIVMTHMYLQCNDMVHSYRLQRTPL